MVFRLYGRCATKLRGGLEVPTLGLFSSKPLFLFNNLFNIMDVIKQNTFPPPSRARAGPKTHGRPFQHRRRRPRGAMGYGRPHPTSSSAGRV